MKKFFYFLICCLLVSGLDARENPFEPTDTYKEKQVEYLKQLELEQQREKKLQEQMEMQEQALLEKEKEIEDLELQRQEELRRIEELKTQSAMLEQEQKQKLLQIKQEQMAQKNRYNVLPFVHIEANDASLTIYVDTKFKLINQDILKPQKKILYDFKGYTSFYTIKKTLQSAAFKSFAVGTHRAKGFFRVVIDLNDTTSNYTEAINPQEGKIVITKKN